MATRQYSFVLSCLDQVFNLQLFSVNILRTTENLEIGNWVETRQNCGGVNKLYKTAALTYKALHGGAPRYLSSLVHVADVPGRRALRSAGSNRLQILPFKLSTVGGRAFPVAAAQFWNRLPDSVTSATSLSSRVLSRRPEFGGGE